MTETFKVGEIALFVREGSCYYGVEVAITRPLFFGHVRDRKDGSSRYEWVYGIDGPFEPVPGTNGKHVATPDTLRKKRPPQDWQKLCSLQDAPVDAPTLELEIA